MAIDDNTSYELTGAQVKDLASKINAKEDSANLAAVATSGDYTDLINTPTIPTVNDATLTIQHNGTNVQTFTANASSNATANIETIWADTIAPATSVAPVTADMIDFSTMYVSAPTPASNVAVNNTKTDIQSITLGAGKWRVCWGYRYAHSTPSTKYIETGLRWGTTDLLSSATNVPVDGNGDCRVLIAQSMEVNPTGPVTYSSWINNAPANANGNCPNTSCYLYALRIG